MDETKWPLLTELGSSAEENVNRDPNITLIKLRLFGGKIAIFIMTEEGLPEPEQFEDRRPQVRLQKIRESKLVPEEIISKLHTLRMVGNKAVHENYSDPDHAYYLLLKAFEIGIWLMQTYFIPAPPVF
ncbi:MAG TPA: hypothetical protein DEB05_08200 [Firmicutes bacterium]|jgi:type I restriction enzyme R subunit|nr:hypothetical protein [Bacillota bacterium]HBT16919.1 hypothetical protein [Bacillota bacterium]